MDNALCRKCKNEIEPKKEKKISTKTYECYECDYICDSKTKLKKHMKTCIDGFTCPACKEPFDALADMYSIKCHMFTCLESIPGGYNSNIDKFFDALNDYFDERK